MASLATNFAASCFLFPVGLKRLFSSSSLYLTNPSIYRSKPWYFSSQFKYLNLDFYILLIALPISSLSELFLFFAFSGGHQTYRFAFSQQSLTLFLFWLLLILIALREQQIWASRIDQNFVFLFGGIAFLIEYSFNGRGISGVGVAGAVYELLGKLSLVCVGSCLYLAVKPTAFWAEFTLSCGLIMKGTWIFQAGLSLGSDAFSMNGCRKLKILAGQEDADVKCDLDEDALRGVALMNLLFVGHAILVLVQSLVLFGFSSFKRSSTFGDATGPLLETNNRAVVSIPPPEYQLE